MLQFVYAVEPVHRPERPRSWPAFARRYFRDRARDAPAGARILLTEDAATASGHAGRLEIVEL